MDTKYRRINEEEIITMRRNMIMLTILYILVNMMSGLVSYAENLSRDITGQIIVNGTALEQRYTEDSNGKLVPLRAIFESLGADVDWYANAKDALSKNGVCLDSNTRVPISNVILITYLDEVYTCNCYEIKRENRLLRTMSITNPNIWNDAEGHRLILEPTGSTGWYKIIDDSIYLYSQTAQYFLKALGVNLDIDEEHSNIIITSDTINIYDKSDVKK